MIRKWLDFFHRKLEENAGGVYIPSMEIDPVVATPRKVVYRPGTNIHGAVVQVLGHDMSDRHYKVRVVGAPIGWEVGDTLRVHMNELRDEGVS